MLPLNHVAYWRHIRHHKQAKINKDVICEKTIILDHHSRVGDKVMRKTKSAYIYKTLFKGTYEIVYTWTNRTVPIQTGVQYIM